MLGSGALGREIVVDGPRAQADDANPGTEARPLKTIGKAAAMARAGDRVVVKAGIYRETVRLRDSGRAGAPIEFVADPPGGVVVSGADPVTRWTRVAGDVPVYQAPWPHVFAINHRNGVPIEHHPERSAVFGRAEQVIADGRHVVAAGTLAKLREAWKRHAPAWAKRPKDANLPIAPAIDDANTWSGLFAVDTRQAKALYVCLADGTSPADHDVQAATRGQTFGIDRWQRNREGTTDGVAHVRVRGFVFRYGATFPQRAAVNLYGLDNVIEDCVVEDMAGGGVNVNGVLRRCVVRRCGHTGGCARGHNFLNQDSPISSGFTASP